MNPLSNSHNIFILRKFNKEKHQLKSSLTVINEVDGVYNYLKNQKALKVFGVKNEKNREERTEFARNVLLEMLGEEEFMKLREIFKQSNKPNKSDNDLNN